MNRIPAATARLTPVTCRKCGEVGAIMQYHCIDVSAYPELRGLLEEPFFVWRCPRCGEYSELAYPCRYFDGKERLSVVLRPSADKGAPDVINESLSGLRSKGYLHRVVGSFFAMGEIVRIREAELDDRAVQLLKPFIIGQLQSRGIQVWNGFFLALEEGGGEVAENTVYMAEEGDPEAAYREPVFRFAIHLTDGTVEKHGINLTAYRHCLRLLEARGAEEDSLYHLYDLNWAIGFHNAARS